MTMETKKTMEQELRHNMSCLEPIGLMTEQQEAGRQGDHYSLMLIEKPSLQLERMHRKFGKRFVLMDTQDCHNYYNPDAAHLAVMDY